MVANGERPKHLVVLDGDETTLAFLTEQLQADGYRLQQATTAKHALWLLQHRPCDLLLMDVVLPDMCGFELVTRVREADGATERLDPELPIVVISGRSSHEHRIRGLRRGADDYLAKPLVYEELAARIEAVLRRGRGETGGVLRVGRLTVDPVSRVVRVEGERVDLTVKEFALLRTLAAEPRRVFTKQELLEQVWGFQLEGKTRTLDSHASRLRRKLGANGAGYVGNVRGVGYRLMDAA